jgi:hypothetical protein
MDYLAQNVFRIKREDTAKLTHGGSDHGRKET